MKLSNFNWTDKSAVRWFILKSGEYEGPYDFDALKERFERQSNKGELLVWAEGLKEALTFEEVAKAFLKIEEVKKLENISLSKIDLKIPLDTPKIVIQNHENEEPKLKNDKRVNFKFKWISRSLILVCLIIFVMITGLKKAEVFTIKRLPKMASSLHEKIQNQFEFKGWNQQLFFKEFVPSDLSEVWLVTESFHHCKIEADFKSMDGKILSLSDSQVSFKAQGFLKDHVVKFSNYKYLSGKKIIPGMYDVNIKATDCFWGNFQIEDHFVMFVNSSKGVNKNSIKKMIDDYSKSQGYFLGQFVMDNNVYFKKIKKSEVFDAPAYENELRLSSKEIGEKSMKFIEGIQALRTYPSSAIEKIKEQMQQDFLILAQKISKRISELTLKMDQRQNKD